MEQVKAKADGRCVPCRVVRYLLAHLPLINLEKQSVTLFLFSDLHIKR